MAMPISISDRARVPLRVSPRMAVAPNQILVCGDIAYRGMAAFAARRYTGPQEVVGVPYVGDPPSFLYRIRQDDHPRFVTDPIEVRALTRGRMDVSVEVIRVLP